MTELNEMTRSLYERARMNDIYRRQCEACRSGKNAQTEQKADNSKGVRS